MSTIKSRGLKDRKVSAKAKDCRLDPLTNDELGCAAALGLDLSHSLHHVDLVQSFLQTARLCLDDVVRSLQEKLGELARDDKGKKLWETLLELTKVEDVPMEKLQEKLQALHHVQDDQLKALRENLLELNKDEDVLITGLREKLLELCKGENDKMREKLLRLSRDEDELCEELLELSQDDPDKKNLLENLRSRDTGNERNELLQEKLLELSKLKEVQLKDLQEKLLELVISENNEVKKQREKLLKLSTVGNDEAKELQEKLQKIGREKDVQLKNLRERILKTWNKGLAAILSQMDLGNPSDIQNLTQSLLYEKVVADSGMEMDILVILPHTRQIIGNIFYSLLSF